VVQVRYGADALQGVVTYGALLRVDNPERLLRPGMTATAEITVQHLSDVVLVPNAALRFSPPASAQRSSGGILRALMPRPPRTRNAETRENGRTKQRVQRLRGGQLEPVSLTIGASDGIWTQVVQGDLAVGDALAVDVKTAVP
jgi:HlyD family secretion protein